MVPQAASPARRRRLGWDLALLALIGLLVLGATGAAAATIHQQFFSSTAFVKRYLTLLSEGRAADAIQLPGVRLSGSAITEYGLDKPPSDALLRRAALASLEDISISGVQQRDGLTLVTAEFLADGEPSSTTFSVAQDGWAGIAPRWRFAKSPLSVLDIAVHHSDRFEVNGFSLDRRQVSPDGIDAISGDPVSMLVLVPGAYSVGVNTPVSVAAEQTHLVTIPHSRTEVVVTAEPTEGFIEVVQSQVEQFLDSCAQQTTLMPTTCPFGISVSDRLAGAPQWSIVSAPTVSLSAREDGSWAIDPAQATAHIQVDVLSLYDGSFETINQDVPFMVGGIVTILPTGTASIRVGAAEMD